MDLSNDRTEELSAQLSTLVTKHRLLDKQVHKQLRAPAYTNEQINQIKRLKKIKLQTKDQIEIIRLRLD